MMLIDSDVLIWMLKGNSKAVKTVAEARPFCVSVVNDIEIVQGVRNKDELRRWRRWLDTQATEVLHINEDISRRAQLLVEQFSLSHHLQLADALIAGCAMSHGHTLLTANEKHFRGIPGLSVKRFRP